MNSQAAHKLIAGVYDVAGGPADWEAWLRKMAAFVNAATVALTSSRVGEPSSQVYEIDEATRLEVRRLPQERLDVARVALLLPHIRRAWHLRKTSPPDAQQRSVVERLAAVLGLGVAVLRGGELVSANATARDILKTAGVLEANAGRLRLSGSDRGVKLRNAIRCAPNSVRSELLVFDDPRAPVYLLCRVVPGDGALDQAAASPADVVVYCARHGLATGLQPLRFGYLCARYQLSEKESRLVAGLAAGKRLNDLAAEYHVSVHTLRVQLKSVFRKTGTHRQSALVDLVIRQAPGLFNLVPTPT